MITRESLSLSLSSMWIGIKCHLPIKIFILYRCRYNPWRSHALSCWTVHSCIRESPYRVTPGSFWNGKDPVICTRYPSYHHSRFSVLPWNSTDRRVYPVITNVYRIINVRSVHSLPPLPSPFLPLIRCKLTRYQRDDMVRSMKRY